MSRIVKFEMCLTLAALGLCASASQAVAQTLTTLVSFNVTDGANPAGGLLLATDGNFYGTTTGGGAHSQGTVFRMSPSGALTTIYSFCSQSLCTDGTDPEGGLIQAADGNLYGTTAGGGGDGTKSAGTVFKITLSGTLTTLATFASPGGQFPYAPLVQGTDGELYGTTALGGSNSCFLSNRTVSCGTVFKITTTGTLTTFSAFSQTNGFYLLSPLIQATDGNFYGTTDRGGTTARPGLGAVFKITPTGTLTPLHHFGGSDGEMPKAGLVQGTDGNFYGTTSFGGGNSGFAGTVFKITPSGTLTTLHSFGGGDGAAPSAALLQATDGNFYGTTAGENSTSGTIFKITPSGTFTSLFSFSGTNGAQPIAPLVEGANHALYGTTSGGGNTACTGGCGTVFSLSAGL